MACRPQLSIIIPAYNEEKRLPSTLESIKQYNLKCGRSTEIIVVDDGSLDRTADIAKTALQGTGGSVIKLGRNFGKGYAVKKGMLRACGEYLLFCDADLSTPIEEIDGFIEAHEKGYDVVIGSRDLPASKVELHQNMIREMMGKIFNRSARMLTFKGIYDSQCGFKSFVQAVGKDLFGQQRMHGFSFDAEIIYLAQKKGYKILEMPVRWRNDSQSRVKIVTDPVKMFCDLIRIRWIHRR